VLIELKTSGTTTVIATLCHGSGHGVDLHVGPGDGLRNVFRINFQIDPILRSTTQKILNRQNGLGRKSFTVQCLKATIEAATLYADQYPVDTPRYGDIWHTEGTKITKYLGGAIEEIASDQIGVTVILTYSIVYSSVAYSTLP